VRKTVILLILVIALFAVFSGCGASTQDITGLWYDKTGFAGTIEFKEDGTVTLVMSDQTYNGTYNFDNNNGEGTINITDPVETASGFILSNGEINVDNGSAIYKRDKVNSRKIGDVIDGSSNAGS
jgi:hypothetical protein